MMYEYYWPLNQIRWFPVDSKTSTTNNDVTWTATTSPTLVKSTCSKCGMVYEAARPIQCPCVVDTFYTPIIPSTGCAQDGVCNCTLSGTQITS